MLDGLFVINFVNLFIIVVATGTCTFIMTLDDMHTLVFTSCWIWTAPDKIKELIN